jgi:cytochrome c oxidase assembly protein subunit 15
MNTPKGLLKVSIFALIFIYLVIVAGSVVRMAGAGMGCPDWPKCFDCWIPPTEESQLPEDYRESFAERREKKIIKFTKFLKSLGFKKEAEIILNDESLREKEAPFNATKTWIEYLNRLVGFIAGNLVLAQFLWVLFRLRKRKGLLFLSFINLLLMGFQAWFGSIVVATNLLPWIISIHMYIALLIVALQIAIIHRLKNKEFPKIQSTLFWIYGLTIIAVLFQFHTGTQVRQAVDAISETVPRSKWLEEIGSVFIIHRTTAWLVVVCAVGAFGMNYLKKWGDRSTLILFSLVAFEVIFGIILAYAGMAAFAQPFHLLLGTLIFGYLCHIILSQWQKSK